MLGLSKHEDLRQASWNTHQVRSRKNRARVREILMRDWDPIGVSGMPEAADEYDAYAAEVYVMLIRDRATEAAIAVYLHRIASEYMGLGDKPGLTERCERAAKSLIGSLPEFERL